MRQFVILSLLFLSAPVLADTLYTYRIESHGGLEELVQTGKVFTAGGSYRMERGPRDGELPPYPVVISKDGGEHETAIDPSHRFYYSPKPSSAPTSALFSLFPLKPMSRSVTNIQLTVLEQDEPEPVSGMKTHEVEIRLSYDIKVQLSKSETVAGKVSLNAKYWMTRDREMVLPVRLRPAIRAGIPEVDSRLSAALAKLQGLPVKQEITISADSHGSTPQKTVVTRTLRDFNTVAAKPGRFEVPKGFQYHEPQFSRPLPPENPQLFGPEKTPPP